MRNLKFNGILKEIAEQYPNIDLPAYLEQELQLPSYKADELASRIKQEYCQGKNAKKLIRMVSEMPESESSVAKRNYSVEKLSQKEFENFTLWLLDELGYVIKEKFGASSGLDVIAIKDYQKTLVLARKFPNTIEVSNSILLIAEQARRTYRCQKTIVISTTRFSETAAADARKANVELWGIDTLTKRIEEVSKNSNAQTNACLPKFEGSLVQSLLALEESGSFFIEPKAEGKYDIHLPAVKHPLLTFYVQSGFVARCSLRVSNNKPVSEKEGINLASGDVEARQSEASTYVSIIKYLEQFLK